MPSWSLVPVEFWPPLLSGARQSLLLCVSAAGLGCVLAVALVALRQSRVRALHRLAIGYVVLIRGLPLLMVVYLVYFVLPQVTGLRLPPLMAGIVALGMNAAAFVSEAIRGGIASVPAGQFEAAKALGLPWHRLWRLVIVPQVLRVTLPALVGEAGFLMKGSPVVALITVVELTRSAQLVVLQTFDPLGPLLAAASLYLIMIGSISFAARLLERRAIRWAPA